MAKVKAKSVPACIWDQHKQQLHNLYITKRNTVGRIQDKMAKKGFHASKHQYRDKFKIWKFRKNCPRPRPAVPATEHGANDALGLGILTTPHPDETMEPFVDITDFEAEIGIIARKSAAQSDRAPEVRPPFPEMAPEILWNEYPVLRNERNTPINGVLPFEASPDPRPGSTRTPHPLVEAGLDLDNFRCFDFENVYPDDSNEVTRDNLRDWEVGAFEFIDPLDLALFDRHDTSGGEVNYFWSSRRTFL